ncbi:MAG: LysM peptidoglycan-binding domain-containing protein [Clostridia bacterium]|nr:LysM peptidoglycan-binding domain-containing protein [Clostridia bacterium]
MRKLYEEYFYIPKKGKIREKVMLMRVALTVLITVGCLFAMSITAFAYFSHTVSTGISVIRSADYHIAVTVTPKSSTLAKGAAAAAVTPKEDGSYTLQKGSYSVLLKKSGTATTGFCLIRVANGDALTEYHSVQLGADAARGTPITEMEFTLELDLADGQSVSVFFIPHWGTSSHYRNENEHTVDVGTNLIYTPAAASSEEDETETETETAEAETVYLVKAGDNLTAIANLYGVSLDKLIHYNGITDPNLIFEGMEIRIPPSPTP